MMFSSRTCIRYIQANVFVLIPDIFEMLIFQTAKEFVPLRNFRKVPHPVVFLLYLQPNGTIPEGAIEADIAANIEFDLPAFVSEYFNDTGAQ